MRLRAASSCIDGSATSIVYPVNREIVPPESFSRMDFGLPFVEMCGCVVEVDCILNRLGSVTESIYLARPRASKAPQETPGGKATKLTELAHVSPAPSRKSNGFPAGQSFQRKRTKGIC